MQFARLISLSCFFVVLSSCNANQIHLQKINELSLPYYFHNNLLFGTDLQAMTKTNDFLIAVGTIDTTDESKPIDVAFVNINNQVIQLDLKETNNRNNEIRKEFTNESLNLLLEYSLKNNSNNLVYYKGSGVIKKQNQQSSYQLFAFEGYR